MVLPAAVVAQVGASFSAKWLQPLEGGDLRPEVMGQVFLGRAFDAGAATGGFGLQAGFYQVRWTTEAAFPAFTDSLSGLVHSEGTIHTRQHVMPVMLALPFKQGVVADFGLGSLPWPFRRATIRGSSRLNLGFFVQPSGGAAVVQVTEANEALGAEQTSWHWAPAWGLDYGFFLGSITVSQTYFRGISRPFRVAGETPGLPSASSEPMDLRHKGWQISLNIGF